MNADKSRVIVTVMTSCNWTVRYNPGRGAPNLQAEGQSKTKKAAFEDAFAEAAKLVTMSGKGAVP